MLAASLGRGRRLDLLVDRGDGHGLAVLDLGGLLAGLGVLAAGLAVDGLARVLGGLGGLGGLDSLDLVHGLALDGLARALAAQQHAALVVLASAGLGRLRHLFAGKLGLGRLPSRLVLGLGLEGGQRLARGALATQQHAALVVLAHSLAVNRLTSVLGSLGGLGGLDDRLARRFDVLDLVNGLAVNGLARVLCHLGGLDGLDLGGLDHGLARGLDVLDLADSLAGHGLTIGLVAASGSHGGQAQQGHDQRDALHGGARVGRSDLGPGRMPRVGLGWRRRVGTAVLMAVVTSEWQGQAARLGGGWPKPGLRRA